MVSLYDTYLPASRFLACTDAQNCSAPGADSALLTELHKVFTVPDPRFYSAVLSPSIASLSLPNAQFNASHTTVEGAHWLNIQDQGYQIILTHCIMLCHLVSSDCLLTFESRRSEGLQSTCQTLHPVHVSQHSDESSVGGHVKRHSRDISMTVPVSPKPAIPVQKAEPSLTLSATW